MTAARPDFVPYDPTGPLHPGITLLEASAGTGKTFSIADLVLRLVAEEDLPIDRILVVTYTEAATAELRERLRARLQQALAALEAARRSPPAPGTPPAPGMEVPAALVEAGLRDGTLAARATRVRAAVEGFDEAAVHTIHGFCRRMLQQNAFESGAEFDAELVADLAPLVDEVVQDYWTGRLHDAPLPRARRLATADLMAQFESLARRVSGDPDMPVLPAALPVPDELDEAPWQAALADLRAAWGDGSGPRDAIERAMAAKALDGRSYQARYLERHGAALDAWLAGDARSEAVPDKSLLFFGLSNLRQKAGKGPPDALAPHPAFAACDALRDASAALDQATDAWRAWLHRDFADEARRMLDQRKAARHQQAFDDLLRSLRDGLRDPRRGTALADAIRRRYRAALIDEFQDTDPVQWEIFRRVFGAEGHWLYLIGDPKQAIYAFRGADVRAYLDAQRAAGRHLTLGTNWRSDLGYVEAVNRVFGRLDDPFQEAEIPFLPVRAAPGNESPRLSCPDPWHPLEIHFLPRPDAAATKPWGKGELNQRLPRRVAAEIARFLSSGATLAGKDGTARPVRPGDVAVLVRGHAQARAVQRCLRRVGVPSVQRGVDSVLRTDEAADVQRLLAALLDPGNPVAVRTALSTPLLGRTAEDLADVPGHEERQAAEGERFVRWRQLWRDAGWVRAFRALLADEGVPERLLARPDGERRLTNLLHLSELLATAALEEGLGPEGLAAWLKRQRTAEDGDAEARQLRLESDSDTVEIVTLHAAKGLEYPVVWCPFLWDGAGLRGDEKAFARFHDPGNGGLRTLDLRPDGDPGKAQSVQAATDEALAEALRLAYVALTRARHRCVIHWGAVNEAGTSALAWLLHPGDAGDDGRLQATRERYDGAPDGTLRQDLQALADGSACAIAVRDVDLQDLAVDRYDAGRGDGGEPAAATWPSGRTLDRGWRRTSFTGLASHDERRPEAAEGRDVDAGTARADAAEPAGPEDRIPLDAFDKGAAAGTFLHGVLEHVDFAWDAPRIAEVVAPRLALAGLHERWRDPVAGALAAVLDTPLPTPDGPVRLRDVPRPDRLDEWAFDLPLAGGWAAGPGRDALSAEGLARVFREHPVDGLPDWPHRLASLGFVPARGFLTGAMDLVFRHRGRWYVVDYKSNHLGPRWSDYRPERLGPEMSARLYVLQYHLYVVALDRFLAWRMGPAYDRSRDLGGVFYLFLRGMSPATGTSGVYAERPPAARIEALSRLLDGTGGAP